MMSCLIQDYTDDACMDSFTTGQFSRIESLWIAFREGSSCYINCAGGPVESPTYDVSTTAGARSVVPGSYSESLTPLSLGDDQVSAIELPFTFDFYGNSFNYAYLSSNGLVSFASAASSATFARPLEHVPAKQGKDDGGIHAEREAVGDVDEEAAAAAAAAVVHVVVLHRRVAASHTHTLANSIRSRHNDKSAPVFEASVLSVQPHLRMLSIRGATKDALSYLSSQADVKYVQQSVEVKTVGWAGTASTSDTYSWGLDRIDQSDLPLDLAPYLPPGAGVNDGSGVSVYVLDTGIDTTHTEFAGRNVSNVFDGFNGGGAISDNNDGNG